MMRIRTAICQGGHEGPHGTPAGALAEALGDLQPGPSGMCRFRSNPPKKCNTKGHPFLLCCTGLIADSHAVRSPKDNHL